MMTTRGGKGQTARSGKPHPYAGFEGGQMPLVRRVPKRGFTPPHRIPCAIVNLASLDQFEDGTVITPELLEGNGLVKSLKFPIKILGQGDVKKTFTIYVHRISESAKAKIEKAGGKVEVI
ncbi:50S ribosomal protein L15 [bacterium]|nr:50S ribosomal protein L15 [bacterium]